MINNLDNGINKALDLFNKKKYTEAKLIFLDLIDNPKVDKKVYFILHETFIRLGDNKNAKTYLIKFLELDNKNHIALNKLANLYLKERQTKKAEEFYLKAIKAKKDYLTAITNLAVFYQGIGDKKNAKKFYHRAIDLSPKNLAVFYNLSKIDKNFINNEKINFIEETLKNEKLDAFNMASGYFLLAEDKKKKKKIFIKKKKKKKNHKYIFDVNFKKKTK